MPYKQTKGAPKLASPAELLLLEQLITHKLADGELDIGVADKSGDVNVVVSYDEYDGAEINFHLYCSPVRLFSFEMNDHETSKMVIIPDDFLSVIPEGLQSLMQQAAIKEKGTLFKPDQLT